MKDGLEFRGVGEDKHSWAHDGSAILHGKKAPSNRNRDDILSHENGSLIGCAVNLDLFQLTFYLMREDDSNTSTIKFRKIEFHDSLYPCVSFDEEEAVRFNFGSTPFAMKVPKDYLPYADNIQALGGNAGRRSLSSVLMPLKIIIIVIKKKKIILYYYHYFCYGYRYHNSHYIIAIFNATTTAVDCS